MHESSRFSGRVAVVTGAASGIGRATVSRLLAEGAQVVGGDLDEAGLASLAEESGMPHESRHTSDFVGRRCDVTVEADVSDLVATAVERFGRLDAMFNVAGATRSALLVDLSEVDWDFTVDVCLKGVFFGIKHAGRQMIAQGPRADTLRRPGESGDGGAIVNVASLNSRVPMFFGGAYSTAKAGVVMLGQTAALELGEHGIRVCTVSPGLTDTPLVAPLTGDLEVYEAYMQRIPLRRMATPGDIASAALYLASGDAGYISGVNLFVDGGWEQTTYPDLRPMVNRLTGG